MAEKYTGIAAGKSIKASDMEAALDRKVSLTGSVTETITGEKTFSASPLVPNKTAAAANRGTVIATEAQVYAHTANTSNPHGVTKVQVGLGNVDNTSDAGKPISTAVQTALTVVQTALSNLSFFPKGTILMYDGASWSDNITLVGWYACIAGNADKGCPNLVDRFIKGGSSSGATGGSNALTAAMLPKHTHSLSNGSANSAGSHGHSLYYGTRNSNTAEDTNSPSSATRQYLAGNPHTTSLDYKGLSVKNESDLISARYTATSSVQSGGAHTHLLSGATNNDNSSTGDSNNSNMPAYYAVIYIRKCV